MNIASNLKYRPKADRVEEGVAAPSASEEIAAYNQELQLLRKNLSAGKWREFCAGLARESATSELTRRGPITRSLFEKNRGYAMDPETLDLIYGGACAGDELPKTEAEIYAWESSLSFCHGIRSRRELAAIHLTELFESTPSARALAIGCGHLREGGEALEAAAASGSELIAVDADPLALQFVAGRYCTSHLRLLQSSASGLLRKSAGLGRFDLIYSLYLLDSLHPVEAEQLIRLILSLLRPGGRMLVACSLPNVPDAAYMEACMDWWPVYRTEEEMACLTRFIAQDKIAGQIVFCDERFNTAFLEVEVSMSH